MFASDIFEYILELYL